MITRMLARLAALALLVVGLAGRAAAQDPTDEFQIGDRILLRVEGDSSLTDTFTVSRGPALVLRVIGELSLAGVRRADVERSEEHTSELQSQSNLVCRLLLEKKKKKQHIVTNHVIHYSVTLT